MRKNTRNRDLVLGVFVAVGVAALVSVVFLIGQERRLFERTAAIETRFPNVAGLASGADVMLAGSPVGHVSRIRFPDLKPDMPGLSRDVTVVMEVSKRALVWIREDSIARIDSKGLLGDKIINISIGSPELPQAQVGGVLQSTPPIDFNKALQQAQEILGNVTQTVADARDIFKGFVAEGGDKALANSAKSLSRLFHEIENGPGAAHALIYDKVGGQDALNSIKELKNALSSWDRLAKNTNDVVSGIKTGPGLAHAVIFDPAGQKTSEELTKTVQNLASLLGEIKSGNGLLHSLIYDEDKGNFIANLNETSAMLKKMAEDLKDGKGSLGLLLKDPGIYNELYGLLGNLNRNRLLKAVIRMGISNQSDQPKSGSTK
jgi:phospholipid/cholesterol/gamma-HCH transport system substrate-binding protein